MNPAEESTATGIGRPQPQRRPPQEGAADAEPLLMAPGPTMRESHTAWRQSRWAPDLQIMPETGFDCAVQFPWIQMMRVRYYFYLAKYAFNLLKVTVKPFIISAVKRLIASKIKYYSYIVYVCVLCLFIMYMKSSFPKRYKSILIVFMKMTFFYLDPYILLIFNLSCLYGLLAQSEHVKQWLLNPPRVRSITPSGSRTRVSGAGGARSNKERQRLQLLASAARAPLCEVRRVRYILNKEI